MESKKPSGAIASAKHWLVLVGGLIVVGAIKLLEELSSELGSSIGEWFEKEIGPFLLLIITSQIAGGWVAPKLVRSDELKPLRPAVAVMAGQFLTFLITALFVPLLVIVDLAALAAGVFWLVKHESRGVLFLGAYELLAIASPLHQLFAGVGASVIISFIFIAWRMTALVFLTVGHFKIRRQLAIPRAT
jgi:hypothetical protein